MGIVVIGAVYVDIKGYPTSTYIPKGRNVGRVEFVHGGVCRNVVEDIANIELRPTFISLVDESATGDEVLRKLEKHKVNIDYIERTEDGMGTWLAVFSNDGDVTASISKRANLNPLLDLLDNRGDEIFKDCDSIVCQIDMEKEIIKRIYYYAKKYNKAVYAVVSNMSIAIERREYLPQTACIVCNEQEASIFFQEDYHTIKPEEMVEILAQKVVSARIPKMVVTMGSHGAVFADVEGNKGICRPKKVDVIDTTGAGDAFFAGVAAGLTYNKTLAEACEIGTRLAASVICTLENVCPRFMPSEFGFDQK